MALIIAGRFGSFGDAERASRGLFNRGFQREDVQIIYVNPPGQHAVTPIGGDEHADAGARQAGKGAWGGVAVGAALGAVAGLLVMGLTELGAVAVVVGLLIGAFGGMFGGTFANLRDARRVREPGTANGNAAPREGGVLVAAHVRDGANEREAVDLLARSGARDIERAQGEWRSGQWIDFDPLHPGEPALAGAGRAGM